MEWMQFEKWKSIRSSEAQLLKNNNIELVRGSEGLLSRMFYAFICSLLCHSFYAVKQLSLHSVLDLASTNAKLDCLFDQSLRVALLGELVDDQMLGHIGANLETLLQLLLHAVERLLVLLGGEAFDTA